jgi:hypothetical protein
MPVALEWSVDRNGAPSRPRSTVFHAAPSKTIGQGVFQAPGHLMPKRVKKPHRAMSRTRIKHQGNPMAPARHNAQG